MNDEEKTKYFIDLYMTALRGFYNNEFLKEPAKGSSRYLQLDHARGLVDAVHGEYVDFLNFQFQFYRTFKTAPTPAHLISNESIMRYRIHQKKVNIFNEETYYVKGDTFTVKKTRKMYPVSQVLLPSSQDPISVLAYDAIANQDGGRLDRDKKEQIKDSLYYLEAKLNYKDTPIPDSVRRYMVSMEEVDENIQTCKEP